MKKAIVIGATSGIGKALAELLVENGFKVGIVGRRKPLLIDLATQHENFHPLAFDITDGSMIKEKLDLLVQRMGGLDLLIFSAGIGELNPELAIDLELPTIEVNVNAFNRIMVWGYHHFESQKNGQIVAITSIAGLRGNAIAPSYNASKAYQMNYLEGLRQKAKKENSGVTITDIRPGFVATAMAKGDQQFWVASPKKAALQIFDAILSKKSVIYITKRWRFFAWLLKLLPGFLYERM